MSLTISINRRPPQACETCLPRTEQYIAKYEHLIGVIEQVSPEALGDYMGAMDWMLATFVPALRLRIFGYYNDEHPSLKEYLSARAVEQIDAALLNTLRQLAEAA